MRRITRYVAGSILGLGGLVGVAIGVISIVDPIGTKMADDGDPFGTPSSLVRSVIITGVFALLTGLGLWLVFQKTENHITRGWNDMVLVEQCSSPLFVDW